MIIKSFTGDSVATALKKVRVEMGGDAVVLKTRQIADQGDGNTVEITACLDKPSTAQANKMLTAKPKTAAAATERPTNRLTAAFAPERVNVHTAVKTESPNPALSTIEKKLDELLKFHTATAQPAASVIQESPVVQALRNADFSEQAIADMLVKNAGQSDRVEDWAAPLAAWIETLIDSKTNFSAGDRIAFVGASGAGKTSALGKLTAYLLSRKQSVVLATADAGKVGAIDEMYSYADLLGATIARIGSGHGVRELQSQASPHRHVEWPGQGYRPARKRRSIPGGRLIACSSARP